MKHTLYKTVPVFLLGLTACAKPPQNVTYVEAVEQPPFMSQPDIITIDKPLPLPGQLQLKPEKNSTSEKDADYDPQKVINHANQTAAQNPHEDGYFNAIMQYTYVPGALYQVYAAPLRLTDIQLQPGEKVIGKPAAGDTARWFTGIGDSKVDGKVQKHVFLKPAKKGQHTNLTINTDKRTYHFELHSYEDTYMAAVNFSYPQDELAELQSMRAEEAEEEKLITSTNININDLFFGYEIEVEEGDPNWKPVRVFDDGIKTFIQFPPILKSSEAPALFVLSSEGDTQLVNYRVKNNYYIIDRLFERAELRVGQDDQTIVRITRED